MQSLIDDVKNGVIIIWISVPFMYAIMDGPIVLPNDAESAYSKFSLLLKLRERNYMDFIEWAEEQKQKLLGEEQ
ncbi:MAG: hypothetical protein CSH37_06280 [Thalassolituus sp.]|nr:MAG: hypothetical protein CSH37_06280 [Thalassolituus sp.]